MVRGNDPSNTAVEYFSPLVLAFILRIQKTPNNVLGSKELLVVLTEISLIPIPQKIAGASLKST